MLAHLVKHLQISFNKEGWAQNIVTNVFTLIGDLSFLGDLKRQLFKNYGAGLAVFGIGSAIVAKFATGFADDIKDNVTTLGSITDEVSKEKADNLTKQWAIFLLVF